MAEIFRLLPAECTPELDSKQRDTLLKNGEYILPGGNSLETVKYIIDVTPSPFYLRYEYSFTTGQRGFLAFELKKFIKKDGSIIIVFSRYGGVPVDAHQQELIVFNYKDKKLMPNKENLLSKEIPIKNYLKSKTPDSIAIKIENIMNTSYSLDSENLNSISFNLFPVIPLEELEKYILGDSISFTWDGKKFIKKLVIYKE
jgi:hypothetical protein